MTHGNDDKIQAIRSQSCQVGRATSFAELAATSLARSYLKRGRSRDARRLLFRFLARHPATPKVAALMREAGGR